MGTDDAAMSADQQSAVLPKVIALQGCSNLRDLGGYRAADGRRLRMGRVFRGASLANLTEAGLVEFAALGIRTICDLRGTQECGRAPSRLPDRDAPEVVALPIEPRVGASLRDLLARNATRGEDMYAVLQTAYSAYAGEHLPRYRRLFELMLEDGRLPLLFHCSAGKDRTGFGAALLLTALDVPRETVIADYLATNRIWTREHALPPDTPPALRDVLLTAHQGLLEHALTQAVDRYGSVERLMAEGLGLDAAKLRRLRGVLLE